MVYNSARRQGGDRGTEMADTADKTHSAPGGPWALLPEEGVKELADRLTEYMTEIEMTDLPAVLEQVLDDFLVQCDGVPEDLEASDAVDRIVNGQLAVTMAYHLGRLEGRAPSSWSGSSRRRWRSGATSTWRTRPGSPTRTWTSWWSESCPSCAGGGTTWDVSPRRRERKMTSPSNETPSGGLQYDLVLKGGTLLDPGQGINDRRDVAFRDGLVAEVAPRIDPSSATTSIDVTGKLVTPGLIDIHGHFYHGGLDNATDADEVCLPAGVTTGIDGGSAGWANYRAMRDYVFPSRKTRLLAFLHIGAIGLALNPVVGGELQDVRYVDPDRTADTIKDNPGSCWA